MHGREYRGIKEAGERQRVVKEQGKSDRFRLKPAIVSVWGVVLWDWWDMPPMCWFPRCTELSFCTDFREVCWCWTFLKNIGLFFGNTLPTESIVLTGFCLAWAMGSLVLKQQSKVSPLDQRATLKGFQFPPVSPCVLTACMLTSTCLPPTLRAWLSGVSVERGCEQKRQDSAEGCQAGLQHQRCFSQFFLFHWAAQPYSNKLHSLSRKLPSKISQLGLHWGGPGAPSSGVNPHWNENLVHSQYGFSSKPVNGRALWAFPGFKICTWQLTAAFAPQLPNVRTLFSLPISELESWNKLHWKEYDLIAESHGLPQLSPFTFTW